MSRFGLSEQDVIERFAHRPHYGINTMYPANSPPQLVDPHDVSWASCSLGSLDRLPEELFPSILQELDLKSLTRLSCVSRRAQFLVGSLIPYRELFLYASEAVSAYRGAFALSLHSVARIRAAFRSERCCCCPEYGPYLFLPTCERACWECLQSNPDLRVVSEEDGAIIFALEESQLRGLPAVQRIRPRSYKDNRPPGPHRLVSVRAIRELAVQTHGSVDQMTDAFRDRNLQPRVSRRGEGPFLREPSLLTRDQDPLMVGDDGDGRIVPKDQYMGLASIVFPSVSPISGLVEYGLWCQPCQQTYFYDHSNEPIANMVPEGCDSKRVLEGLMRRARTRAGFAAHANECYGLRKMMEEESCVQNTQNVYAAVTNMFDNI